MIKIKPISRTWLFTCISAAFVLSCGGGEPAEVTLPTTGGASSSSSSSSSGNPVVVSQCQDRLDAGKQIFEGSGNCSACHGDNGLSTAFKTIDLTAATFRHSTMGAAAAGLSLPDYIALYMPQPGVCKGECADNVAVYVRSLGGQAWCPSEPSEKVEKVVAMQALHRLNVDLHSRLIEGLTGVYVDPKNGS